MDFSPLLDVIFVLLVAINLRSVAWGLVKLWGQHQRLRAVLWGSVVAVYVANFYLLYRLCELDWVRVPTLAFVLITGGFVVTVSIMLIGAGLGKRIAREAASLEASHPEHASFRLSGRA